MDPPPDTLRQLALPHRRATLLAMLWTTVVAGAFFGLINLVLGAVAAALLEFAMCGLSAYLLYSVPRARHLERWMLAYTLPFFSVMMLLLYLMPDATDTLFVWTLLIPLVAHLLLGRRLGLFISLLFMSIAAFIFWNKNHGDPELTGFLPAANIVLVSLCILYFTHTYEISRERTELQLLRAARTDFLTGVANLAGLSEFFRTERTRALRQRQALSLLLLDLDHFKRVNDVFGHDAGDAALKFVAALMRERLRSTDLVARLGGEEFACVLVNTTGETAVQVAENLRLAVAGGSLDHAGRSIGLTMSIGVAQFGRDGEELQSLLAAADKRLYQAKAAGRNRVVCATPAVAADAIRVRADELWPALQDSNLRPSP
ncbi:MAG: GGDEF domain-containing protein [Halioglobus sp.]|nr:GGDEF domain-containing protein [Halioglobus sp.]